MTDTDQPAPEPAPAHGGLVPSARTAALLGLLVLVAFVVRIDALRNNALPVAELGDAKAYELLGRNLADGVGYVRPYEYAGGEGHEFPTAEYPPALPVLIGAADLVGIDGATGLRTVLCGVGALTVGLIGLIGRRLGGDGVGLLAAFVAAIHPALWNVDVTLMAEPLAAFTGAALVLAALAVADRPVLWRWLALGALTGLGCFVRSEFLLMGPLLMAVLALKAVDGWGSRLRYAGASLAALVLVLLPWTIRNYAAFGQLVPLTNNSGSVSKGANCDAAYRGQFKGLWVTNVTLGGTEADASRAGCFSGFDLKPNGPNEAEVAARLRREGLSYARHHAGELPSVMAARVGRTVGLYRFTQQSNFAYAEGRNPIWERRGTRSFQLLAVLGIVGFVVAAVRRRLEWERSLLLVPPVAVLVVVALTYGNPRFRSAAEPAVVVMAALGVFDVVAAISDRRSPG